MLYALAVNEFSILAIVRGFFVSAQQVRAFSRMGLGLNAPSALSAVVNAQADTLTYQLDGEVKAHHGDDG